MALIMIFIHFLLKNSSKEAENKQFRLTERYDKEMCESVAFTNTLVGEILFRKTVLNFKLCQRPKIIIFFQVAVVLT